MRRDGAGFRTLIALMIFVILMSMGPPQARAGPVKAFSNHAWVNTTSGAMTASEVVTRSSPTIEHLTRTMTVREVQTNRSSTKSMITSSAIEEGLVATDLDTRAMMKNEFDPGDRIGAAAAEARQRPSSAYFAAIAAGRRDLV